MTEATPAERRFPIQGGPSIPWRVIAPHEYQAKRNHDQSLERLAERHGLSPIEAFAVLESRPIRDVMNGSISNEEALAKLNQINKKEAALQKRFKEVVLDLEMSTAKLLELQGVQQRHARLREWTKRHSTHQGTCKAWHAIGNKPNDNPCTCGLRAALEEG